MTPDKWSFTAIFFAASLNQMLCRLITSCLFPLSVLQILRTQQWLCLRCLPVSTAAVTHGYTWSSAVTSSKILCTASPASKDWALTSRRRTQTAVSAEQHYWPGWTIAAPRAVRATGKSWNFLQSPPFRWSKHAARQICLLSWEWNYIWEWHQGKHTESRLFNVGHGRQWLTFPPNKKNLKANQAFCIDIWKQSEEICCRLRIVQHGLKIQTCLCANMFFSQQILGKEVKVEIYSYMFKLVCHHTFL